MGHFYIKLQDSESTSDELDQRIEQQLLNELKISNPLAQIVMILNKAFIGLSMRAKGKADLYFHAYFWQEYLRGLNDN